MHGEASLALFPCFSLAPARRPPRRRRGIPSLLHDPGGDDQTFPYQPRFRESIGNYVANNQFRKYLANQGRQTLVLEILRGQQDGQDAADKQLTVCGLVLRLRDEGAGIARFGDRRERGQGAERMVDFVRIGLEWRLGDGAASCSRSCDR